MTPSVYVLLLNYNGIQHLAYSVPSVLGTDYPNAHTLLIDNGSEDGSVAFVRDKYPCVEIIENGRNLGWAAGNNRGISHALALGADYVVLLNNDMRVDPRWLTNAVAAAESDPSVGIVGFDTIGEYHVEADPELTTFKRRQAAWRELEVIETEHIAGCALFLRAALLQSVGLLDESYFAYGEEDDLQKRARRAGYRSVRVNVPLWHYNGGYWDQSRLLKAAVMAQRNVIRVMVKADTPRVGLRRFRDMVIFICWPGVEYDRNHAHLRRLRPSSYPINVAILLYAILWNLVALPGTLLARHRDEQRIRRARQALAAQQAQDEGKAL